MTSTDNSLNLTLSYVESFAVADKQRLKTFSAADGVVSLGTYAGTELSLPAEHLKCRISHFGSTTEYTIEDKTSRNRMKICRPDSAADAESWQRIEAFLNQYISDDRGIGRRAAHRIAIADEYYQSDRSILQTYFLDPIFRHFADFNGRMSRKEFLGFMACDYAVINFLAAIPILLLIFSPLSKVENIVLTGNILLGIYILLTVVPRLSAAKRYSNLTYAMIFPLTLLQFILLAVLFLAPIRTIVYTYLLVFIAYIIILYLSCYVDDNSPKPTAKTTLIDRIVISTGIAVTVLPALYVSIMFLKRVINVILSWQLMPTYEQLIYIVFYITITVIAFIIACLPYLLVYIVLKKMHDINENLPSYDRPLNE